MRRIFFLWFILLPAVTFARQLEPVSKSSGRMKISVDPRIELLCAVQCIADYPTINRESDYSKELIEFFKKDSASDVAKLTTRLAKEYGFEHDAPIDLILALSTVPKLRQATPFGPRTIERAGNKENLEKYQRALQRFAVSSHFTEFWNSKIPFYQKMVEYTLNELDGYDPVSAVNNYYNESKKSYTVVLSPALMGGYGLRVTDKHNEMDIYACLNTDKIKDGVPFYSKDGLCNYVYHEFSHSFVNPLTDNYLPVVDATSGLFRPIEKEVSGNYGRWIICLNEHIVRAVHIRILHSLGQKDAADNLLELEKSRGFVYIGPILNKLKQFEHERDVNKTTFTRFYPKLMAVFDSLAHSDNKDLIDPLFYGPVQNVLSKQKVAIIYPTNDEDKPALKSVFDYTSGIQKVKGKFAVLYADTVALKTDLSDNWILAYGTMESNLFLKKHGSLLPFRIAGDTIFTDRKLVGRNLRMITCIPNPQNCRRGMLVNTATRNQSLKGVAVPAKVDYLVFEDINNIIQSGTYVKKEKQWEFPPEKKL